MDESMHQALPQGSHLEEYEIRRELGSGGFGITYVAWDRGLEREVVLKENLPVFAFRDTVSGRVRPRSSKGEDVELFAWSLENFIREARTLARFDHPNIVRVLRVFEANGTAYFVMPKVEGRALDEVFKQRLASDIQWSEEELCAILLPMLVALGELHDQGVYHRDIKPANILLTSSGRPVLIDFGAARQCISQKSLTVIESAGYTPFEQLESHGNVGPWSDLYGLAGTMYCGITGERPPKAGDRVKRDRIRCLASEYAGAYSPAFLRMIDQALSFDEAARPQSSADWLVSLQAPTQSRPVILPSQAFTPEDESPAEKLEHPEDVVYQNEAAAPVNWPAAVQSYTESASRGISWLAWTGWWLGYVLLLFLSRLPGSPAWALFVVALLGTYHWLLLRQLWPVDLWFIPARVGWAMFTIMMGIFGWQFWAQQIIDHGLSAHWNRNSITLMLGLRTAILSILFSALPTAWVLRRHLGSMLWWLVPVILSVILELGGIARAWAFRSAELTVYKSTFFWLENTTSTPLNLPFQLALLTQSLPYFMSLTLVARKQKLLS